MFIHVIEDARALLRSGGAFYQKKVFRGPNDRLFAEWGGGFIRLGGLGAGKRGGDATSKPTVAIEALDLPFTPLFDSVGNPLFTTNSKE